MATTTPTPNFEKLTAGDFIEIPAWRVVGCVMSVETSWIGSEDSVSIRLQEYPDQPEASWGRYRLEPSEYIVL